MTKIGLFWGFRKRDYVVPHITPDTQHDRKRPQTTRKDLKGEHRGIGVIFGPFLDGVKPTNFRVKNFEKKFLLKVWKNDEIGLSLGEY